MASSAQGPAPTIVFGGTARPDETLAALFAKRPEQSQTGFQPIQILGRITIAVRRRDPGEMQKMGGPQRAIKLLDRSRTCRSRRCQVIPSASSRAGLGSPRERETRAAPALQAMTAEEA